MNRLINMAVNMILRRVMRTGIDAGMDALAKRKKGQGNQAGAQQDGQPQARKQGGPNTRDIEKRARTAVRLGKRLGRF